MRRQPLTREQLWETATSAAEAAAASKAAAPAAEEGGEPTAGGDAAAGGNATGGSDGAQRSQPGLWGEDQQAAADAKVHLCRAQAGTLACMRVVGLWLAAGSGALLQLLFVPISMPVHRHYDRASLLIY